MGRNLRRRKRKLQRQMVSRWRYVACGGLLVHAHRSVQLSPKPEYFDHRIKMFDQLKAEYDEWVKGVQLPVCLSRSSASCTEQHNHDKRSRSRCPTGRNGKGQAGRRARWASRRRFRKVSLTASLLRRFRTSIPQGVPGLNCVR